MSENWYNKLGFYHNPFSMKPAAFRDQLVAYDLDYIYKKIELNQMLFIDGFYGTGKTTILKNIINKYKGKKKIIYFNFSGVEHTFDVDSLIDGANPIIKRVLGLKPSNVLMLMDEVTEIPKKEASKLAKYYSEGSISSVVMVGNDYNTTKLTRELEALLKGHIIRTANLSPDEAVVLIRGRIGKLNLLSDKVTKLIFKYSESNPRRLLENCEDICKQAVENQVTEITDYDVNAFFGVRPTKSPKIVEESIKIVTAKAIYNKSARKIADKLKIEKPLAAAAFVLEPAKASAKVSDNSKKGKPKIEKPLSVIEPVLEPAKATAMISDNSKKGKPKEKKKEEKKKPWKKQVIKHVTPAAAAKTSDDKFEDKIVEAQETTEHAQVNEETETENKPEYQVFFYEPVEKEEERMK